MLKLDINALKEKSEQIKGRKNQSFPVNVLPSPVRDFVNHLVDVRQFNADFMAVSAFTALSSAFGNAFKLTTYNGYTATANLFVAIVGGRGTIKTPALSEAFKPIDQHQAKKYSVYSAAVKAYKANPDNFDSEPIMSKTLLSDATPEVIARNLAKFPKGTTVKIDELGQFLAFDKYRKGADEQAYLSAWSNETINIDRVNGTTLIATDPYLSVIGTIQPEVLQIAFSGKEASGFSDRWLFCAPDNLFVPYPKIAFCNPAIQGIYTTVINRLLDLKVDEDNQTLNLKYSPEARQLIFNWENSIVDKQNDPDTTETEKGILAKMKIYIHRFALILEVAESACMDQLGYIDEVCEASANGAIEVANYFIAQSNKVRPKTPLDLLTPQWRELYDMLPDDDVVFTTADFMNACQMIGINKKTAEKWLKNHSAKDNPFRVLKWVKHGHYAKI